MATVVRTEHLTKEFRAGFPQARTHRSRRRSQMGLDGLSLEIPAGGVFGLLGPNGAGKTTTLKLLVDLLRPTSGRAEVLGFAPGDIRARQRLGFLPEHPTFYDYLTGLELVTYFAGLGGLGGAESRARAGTMLDLVRIGAERDRPLRQYSKGMIQRVGIAQALVNDPELVILDEPMSGLDPLGRREVRELIIRLRDEGRTVLFSSHILSDAELLCTSVAILAKGKLVAGGTLSELTAGGGRGWEIVAMGVPAAFVTRCRERQIGVTPISDGRFSFDLPVKDTPEPFIAELASAGASLVSALPIRITLEDVFMERVG